MALTPSGTADAAAEVQITKTEQPLFGKENTTWNFNLGMSDFDANYGEFSGFKGKGLAFEFQKRFWDIFYAGAAYMNYTTEGHPSMHGDGSLFGATKSSLGNAALSLEGHVIRLPLPARSEFFASVTTGLVAAMSLGHENEAFVTAPGFFFGAGVGINLSNQIGLRADVKSTRDVRAYNSVSLVGYY